MLLSSTNCFIILQQMVQWDKLDGYQGVHAWIINSADKFSWILFAAQ